MPKSHINLTAEQVQLALSGQIFQHREPVKAPSGHVFTNEGLAILWGAGVLKCPYGSVGDILPAREAWYYDSHMHELTDGEPDLPDGHHSSRLVYKASIPDWQATAGWKSAAVMPLWASRLDVVIVAIRAELGADGREWVLELQKSEGGTA